MVSTQDRPEAVIFDYGGVLTTSGRAAIEAWTAAEGIRTESFSATLKEWLSRGAPTGTPIHRLETGELPAEEFNRLLAERLQTRDGHAVAPEGLLTRLFAHMRSEPAMLRLVRDLRAAGVRTALLSNSWGNSYPRDQLDGLFETIVISGEVGLRKPDPEIFGLVLEHLGLPPEHTVFVDDGVPNTEAAEKLGIRAVLHRDARRTREQLVGLVPGLEADDIEEAQ